MPNTLKSLRAAIQKIDISIIKSINRRLSIARRIGLLKNQRHIPIVDAKRERKLKVLYRRLAAKNKIPLGSLLQIFNALIKESKHIQKNAKKP